MNSSKQVHFIGAGGIGMRGLVKYALFKGLSVSGSDRYFSEAVNELSQLGMKWIPENQGLNIDTIDQVVYSSAIKKGHLQRDQAEKNGTLVHRSEYLSKLISSYNPLCVLGTHGKTSTSSLLAWTLLDAEVSKNYYVGGILANTATSASFGQGDYITVEADESDGSFVNYSAYGAIVTNLEADHLDHWRDFRSIYKAMKDYLHQIDKNSKLIWCRDDEALGSMNLRGKSYGIHPEAHYHLVSYQPSYEGISFVVKYEGKEYFLELPLFGFHNALNATSVFALCMELGLNEKVVHSAFKKFKGTHRRQEYIGTIQSSLFYDDYAHHPTEVSSTLDAFRMGPAKGKALRVIFQAHRYSRFIECFDDFLESFHSADEVWVTDVFSAGEERGEGPGVKEFVLELRKRIQNTHYIPFEQLESSLLSSLSQDEVWVTLGAGNITQFFRQLNPLQTTSIP